MKRSAITNAKGLSFGIYWVVSESEDLQNYTLLYFNVRCDTHGNAIEIPALQLNSKSGKSYNHKAMWDSQVKNNPLHKPYNKKDYDYYPRGRVEISNSKAVIYLSPIISETLILDEIKAAFGLSADTIANVKIAVDNSAHYRSCLFPIMFEHTQDTFREIPLWQK